MELCAKTVINNYMEPSQGYPIGQYSFCTVWL